MTVIYKNGFDYAENRTDGTWVQHDVREEDKNCFYPEVLETAELMGTLRTMLKTEA